MTNKPSNGGPKPTAKPPVNITPPKRPDPRVVPPAVRGDYPPKPLPTKPVQKPSEKK